MAITAQPGCSEAPHRADAPVEMLDASAPLRLAGVTAEAGGVHMSVSRNASYGTQLSPSGIVPLSTPRPPKLDERLRVAADWVRPCEVCADIGCDHGRFGAVLLLENRCRRLLAADISEKALARAVTRLGNLRLKDRVTFAVADGLNALDALPGSRADTVCILGMGGDTVAGILLRGKPRLQGAALILGAQTEHPLARKAIQQIGYRLEGERVVRADGRLYLLMRAVPAPEGFPPYTERELLMGPCLLAALPPEWKPWLARKQRLLAAAAEAMRSVAGIRYSERLAATERELRYTEEALEKLEQRSRNVKPDGRKAP